MGMTSVMRGAQLGTLAVGLETSLVSASASPASTRELFLVLKTLLSGNGA